MKDIILSWGLNGFLGVSGCYLVVCSIMGCLVRIPMLVRTERELETRIQRALLGAFGILLALPIIVGAYSGVFRGTLTFVSSPETKETVTKEAPPPSHSLIWDSEAPIRYASYVLGSAESREYRAASALIGTRRVPRRTSQTENCREVEAFGLVQRNIRRLKSEEFKGQVFVYIGDIKTLWGSSHLYVFVASPDQWPESGYIGESDFERRLNSISPDVKRSLDVKRPGDHIDFDFGGRSYDLSVTKIYSVLLGDDKIALRICAL